MPMRSSSRAKARPRFRKRPKLSTQRYMDINQGHRNYSISLCLTTAQLSARLGCAECDGQVHSVKPWRLEDVLGKPQGVEGDWRGVSPLPGLFVSFPLRGWRWREIGYASGHEGFTFTPPS